jgi:hypothetical protein
MSGGGRRELSGQAVPAAIEKNHDQLRYALRFGAKRAMLCLGY